MENEVYLGDAVYASFDGYHIWLRTGDGKNQRIALEPLVYQQLQAYAAIVFQPRKETSDEQPKVPEGEGPADR